MDALRILHLSDLHIGHDGKVQSWIDDKYGHPQIREALEPHVKSDLVEAVKQACGGAESLWPKAIIISGDLVNFGGGRIPSVDGENDEFRHARRFIDDLAHRLKVEPHRVFVVPGNHDVNWSPGLDYLKRFEGFMQATEGYSAPTITNGQLKPLVSSQLSTIVPGVKVELTLLVSPTFSGIANRENEAIVSRLRRLLSDLSQEHLDRIADLITEGRGAVDVAAVGSYQREFLVPNSDRDTIRLAVLHHHLLPDPNIEIAPFESVVDAGLVLQRLIDAKFDLVLSGHKHNRRLVQYEHRGKRLDVYNAASTFVTGATLPEFTLIDIFGPTAPYYARLTSYDTRSRRVTESQDLVREGRVLPQIVAKCGRIGQQGQEQYALPLLDNLDRALAWRDDFALHNPDGAALFGRLFSAIMSEQLEQLQEFGQNHKLTFKGAALYDHWSNLIDLAERAGVEHIRVVSENDLEFWLARKQDNSDAFRYAEPLRRFKREKVRIMVLPRAVWDDPSSRARVEEAIAWMRDDGFQVGLVWKEEAPEDVRKDFGLLGRLAVSRFVNMKSPTEARTLQERFGADAIAKAERDWHILQALIRVNSDSIRPQPPHGRMGY
jgi:3',5'-cyclic AMP phosphodiesterase CpdA